MNTIKMIRSKDPKIYDQNTTFYTTQADSESSESDSDEGSASEVTASKKKKTFKDVLREQLLENQDGGDHSDEDLPSRVDPVGKTKSALLYDKEQEQIRKTFLKTVDDQNVVSDSDDNGNDILQVRQRDAADMEREEEALRKTIDEVTQLTGNGHQNIPEEEMFLAEYMKKKKWVDPLGSSLRTMREEASSGQRVLTIAEEDRLLDLEDDEKELEEVDQFESKYNFRFEELQGVWECVVCVM